MRKRDTYAAFLSSVPILSTLTQEEINTVADALQPVGTVLQLQPAQIARAGERSSHTQRSSGCKLRRSWSPYHCHLLTMLHRTFLLPPLLLQVTVSAGEVVVRQGDADADRFYIIEDGGCSVFEWLEYSMCVAQRLGRVGAGYSHSAVDVTAHFLTASATRSL